MAADEETIKRRYREFIELMPLTINIAGLPPSEGPFNFSADQMEIRIHTLARRVQAGPATGPRERHRQIPRQPPWPAARPNRCIDSGLPADLYFEG